MVHPESLRPNQATNLRTLHRLLLENHATLDTSPPTPLTALHNLLKTIFSVTTDAAVDVATAINATISSDQTEPSAAILPISLRPSDVHQSPGPTACSWTGILIGTLACQHHADAKGVKSFAGPHVTPHFDLMRGVREAQAAAKTGKATVLVVNIVDCGIEPDRARGIDAGPTGLELSLDHVFVLAIDERGTRVYMSYINAYDLGTWFEKGYARVRNEREIEEFVMEVQDLVGDHGAWNGSLKAGWERAFGVDLDHWAMSEGLLIDRQKWNLRMGCFVIRDVKVENVRKFRWELADELEDQDRDRDEVMGGAESA